MDREAEARHREWWRGVGAREERARLAPVIEAAKNILLYTGDRFSRPEFFRAQDRILVALRDAGLLESDPS
jgi:hypothetical protein